MKKFLIPTIFLALCGYANSEPSEEIAVLTQRIEDLEQHLGDLRYIHLNPKLEVVIEEKGIREREENFGLKEYYITGKIFLKSDFPVSRFGLNITYKITFENGSAYDGVIVVEEFEGDVVSFETIPFVNAPAEQLAGQKSEFKGVSFNWWPEYKRPNELIEIIER